MRALSQTKLVELSRKVTNSSENQVIGAKSTGRY